MAKPRTIILAFALFCLFTVSLAGTPLENDESTTQVSLPLSEAADPALSLPSEPVNTQTDSNSAVVSSVPLTKITFWPVNRRFHVGSKHPCRHHSRFYPTMREHEEIPYGNDMLVSSGENSDFQETVLHIEGQRIPGRWIRKHHQHHRYHHDDDSDSDDDGENENRVNKIAFKKFDHLKKLRKRYHEEEEKTKKGGFMKRVRKFLDHYF